MKKIKYLLLLALLPMACTDLKEELIDESTGEELLESPTSLEGLVAPVYARLRGTFSDQARFFALAQHTSDETMGPTRGKDWDDNGIWRSLHQHNWDANHDYVTQVFNELNNGVARAIIALNQMDKLSSPDKELYRAEVRGLRAFYMYNLLDLYGKVPTRDESSLDFTVAPTIMEAPQAFDFIVSELEAVIPTLKEKGDIHYGRFHKGAAQAILAKLYLNKAVYLDRYADNFTFADADMDKVIQFTTDVINSGKYSLATDYWDMFAVGNNNHPEHILVVEQRLENGLGGNNYSMMQLHYNQKARADFEPWNGFTTIADFYNKWDQNDPRFRLQNLPAGGSVAPDDYKLDRGFLEGQQYGAVVENGAFKTDANGNILIEPLKDRAGNPLIYTLDVPIQGANETQGVRVLKYEPDTRSGSNNSDVDYVILRLADVYLMRAEAKLRKGDVAGALEDVAAVRAARGADPIGDLTLDGLLDERGFELYWEMYRRQDQIRFGKWENAWHEKTVADKNRRLFPIPQTALDANPGLRQNQGY
jgi:hypothetical protein